MSRTLMPLSIQPVIPTQSPEKKLSRTAWHILFWALTIVVGNGLLVALMLSLSSRVRDNAFTENFDDPTLLGWEHTANARVFDGVLRMEPGNGAFTGCCWGNISLTVSARRLGNGFLSISYRAGDMGAYIVELGDHGVTLARAYYGDKVVLASTPVTVPAGTWVTVHITAIGNSHIISLDGKTVLEVQDSNPFPPSMIALVNEGTEGATGEFDNLRVIGDSELEVTADHPPAPSDQPHSP